MKGPSPRFRRSSALPTRSWLVIDIARSLRGEILYAAQRLPRAPFRQGLRPTVHLPHALAEISGRIARGCIVIRMGEIVAEVLDVTHVFLKRPPPRGSVNRGDPTLVNDRHLVAELRV